MKNTFPDESIWDRAINDTKHLLNESREDAQKHIDSNNIKGTVEE